MPRENLLSLHAHLSPDAAHPPPCVAAQKFPASDPARPQNQPQTPPSCWFNATNRHRRHPRYCSEAGSRDGTMHAWGQAHLFTEDQYWQVVIYKCWDPAGFIGAPLPSHYNPLPTVIFSSALHPFPSPLTRRTPPGAAFRGPGPLARYIFTLQSRGLGYNSARDYRQLTYTRLKYVIKEGRAHHSTTRIISKIDRSFPLGSSSHRRTGPLPFLPLLVPPSLLHLPARSSLLLCDPRRCRPFATLSLIIPRGREERRGGAARRVCVPALRSDSTDYRRIR